MTLFSIITVVKNGDKVIEKTLKSVINQNYSWFEFIVVNGESTDKTSQIIKKYQEKITHVIEEPDTSVYEGMNKAIKKASGTWLLFVNSGDSFVSNSSLNKLAEYLAKGEKKGLIVFPILRNSISLYPKKFIDNSVYVAKFFGQQSILYHRDLFEERKFDLNFKFLADLEFSCYQLIENKMLFSLYPQPVLNYPMTGLTAQKRYFRDCAKERFFIYKKYHLLNFGEVIKFFIKMIVFFHIPR